MTATIRCMVCHSTATIGTPSGGYCGRCDDFVFVYVSDEAVTE